MAFGRLSCWLWFSLFVFAIPAFEHRLSVAASLTAEPDTPGFSSSPQDASARPRRRWFGGAWRRVAGPFRRALRSLRDALSSRSREEASEELKTLERAAARYFDCFPQDSVEDKAGNAISTVCATLKSEALKRNCGLFAMATASKLKRGQDCISQVDPEDFEQRIECLKKNRLFLVHPWLHESISSASPEDFADAERWLDGLRFKKETQGETVFPGGDALTQAFARLNASFLGSVDNQHIRISEMLKRSTVQGREKGGRLMRAWRRIRGLRTPVTTVRKPDAQAIVTEGFRLFVSIPPHADPLAVRLATIMLAEGASCPPDGSFGRSEKVTVGGRPRSVKAKDMIEAAILIAIEALFDASDCAAPQRSEKSETDMTCRLLDDYYQYMQAGGPVEGSSDAPERLQEIRQASFGLPGENESRGGEGLPSPGGGGREHEESLDSEGVQDLQDLFEGGEEPTQNKDSEASAGEQLEELSRKADRLLLQTKNAAAAAVATSRLSLKSGTLALRLVIVCLRSSFFIRYTVRILLAFMGKELIPRRGLAAFLGKKQHGKLYLGIYVSSLVELSTGNSRLGILSANAAKTAVEEENRVIVRQERLPVAFVQGGVSPKAMYRTLETAGMRVSHDVAAGLASGLMVASDILLAVLVVAISVSFPPTVVVVAILLAVLLLVKAAVNTFNALVPETAIEKVERKGRGAIETLKKVAQQI